MKIRQRWAKRDIEIGEENERERERERGERETGDGAKIEKFFRATIPRLLFAVGCCKIWQNVVG